MPSPPSPPPSPPPPPADDTDNSLHAPSLPHQTIAPPLPTEQTPLLLGTTPPSSSSSSSTTAEMPPRSTSLSTYLTTPISPSHADLVLLFSYITTGLLDSSSVLIWGSFVSMQTGNSVYVGSGLIDAGRGRGDDRWLRALISICAFVAGAFFFSRFHRVLPRLSPSLSSISSEGDEGHGGGKGKGKIEATRWVLVAATGLQLAFVVGAALMVTLGPVQGREAKIGVWVAVPIVLLAFQSAGQAFVSRVVGFSSLTGVVLTSIYLDLAGDAKLFAGVRANAERNRRLAAPVLLLVGAVLGGLWAQSDVGMKGALWTAVGLKAAVMLAWVFWPGVKAEVRDGDIV